MTSATVVVTADDGTGIGVQVTGEGPPVILVHGAASDARQWALVVPLIAAAGFTVMAMDRRGRGASGPQGVDHSLETDFSDIVAVARAAAAPAHLVGHSSGARYALHAAQRIGNLASLTLYEPPAPEFLTDPLMASLSLLADAGDRIGVLRAFFVDAAGVDQDSFEHLALRPVWPLMVDNALTLPAELRAARLYRFDPSVVAGFEVPTRLLLGEFSGPELVGVSNGVLRALANSSIQTLPGQGHGAMVSAPELFSTHLVAFFEEVRDRERHDH